MASQDWFEKDFYAILGVPQDADATAIKKAYRKLARKEHPDQNPGDANAEKRFKEIGEAYAVLSDPEERQQYDAIRSMTHGGARFRAGGPGGAGGAGFEDVFSSMFGGGGGAGGAGPRVRFSTGGGGAQPNLEDILGGMFGGGGPAYGGYGAPAGPRRGANVTARTTLSFRDAVEGATVTLSTGNGRRITTRIPAGVRDGQTIRLAGKGEPGDQGAPSGDLMLQVEVQKHPVFGRDGDNLTVDLPVTFAEAALGATVSVPTLSGEPVKVRIAPGTPSGRVLRVKGRGVPRKDHQGDLLAKVSVVVPQRLTDEARQAVEALQAQEEGVDPRADLFARARQE
ncbi:DnaJ C-terminal domain-containing protein [Phycicoccus sp. SLBN-51]|jgi:molecular chaperone DnaJ|uniref:DnaJ C-terminal domain-containing protein n=1 Tax=Phycicoccus sp. SLBN-51 TaxID=2768447 RepID=UPI0011513F2C|nr:DnaJ C-terminal domain-containing protein [Phycicoccus sp. SLBN-51]TQJ48685.1 molecular chaperone DnaJ [Phycicoccus sp. SLBN-51]